MLFNKKALWLAPVLALVGCGYPATQLSPAEKNADVEWVFSVFERNYAPADWKKETLQVDLAQAKERCRQQTANTKDNAEFFHTVQRCVRQFADGHVNLMMQGMLLPENISVAHLGFMTTRGSYTPPAVRVQNADPGAPAQPPRREALVVSKMLSTSATGMPVSVGDVIVSVDGAPVEAYLQQHLIPFIDVGQPSSNMRIAASAFGVRTSDRLPMPQGDNVRLGIMRGEQQVEVTLPWNRNSLFDFLLAQRAADAAAQQAEADTPEGNVITFRSLSRWINMFSDPNLVPQRFRLLLRESFRWARFSPLPRMEDEKPSDRTDIKGGGFPFQPAFDLTTDALPAAVFPIQKGGATLWVGYIRVSQFAGGNDVTALESLITRFNQFNVQAVMIDMLDNGGGSLIHGLQMADMLTARQLDMPRIQFRLNDNWINSFRSQSIWGANDAERTLGTRLWESAQADARAGKRLSSPVSTRALLPLDYTKGGESCAETGKCLKPNVKVGLLVNEFCASMCDIFASMVRDNQLGTIYGAQTMGAGGNVTQHVFSPISRFILSQTESLVVDTKGGYLENRGVIPDVPLNVVDDRALGYQSVLTEAINHLVGQVQAMR